MIQKQDLFNTRFYDKSCFYGSFQGMHYRIEKISDDDGSHFQVTTWPGPYNYETTSDDLKKTESFPFTEDGLQEACDYLNQTYESQDWPTAIF